MVQLTLTHDSGQSVILDLYENEKASLNFEFSDPATLTTRGSFSQVFRVPGSDRNLGFFGMLGNVNAVGEFSFHKKVKAVYTYATIPVSVGHVQVIRVVRNSNGFSDIEINFYAETPDLTRQLGSKMLGDLDYSDLAHDMTFDTVVNGDASDRWFYGLIDRGYKFSEQGEAGTRAITETDTPIYPSEMALHIHEAWLFDKIIREAGFTYVTANIMDEMESVHVPFVASKYNKSTTTPSQYLFSAYLTSNLAAGANEGSAINGLEITGLTETLDANGDLNAATGVYTAPFTGWFTFRLWGTNDPTASSGSPFNYRIIRLKDNLTNNSLYYQNTSSSNGHLTKNLQSNDVTLFLEQGAEVVMAVLNTAAGTFLGGTSDPSLGTGWALVNTSDALAGLPIGIGLNAPTVKQIDFILDVLKKYNLVFLPDRNLPKQLFFQPFKDYIGSGSTLDWDKKIDNKFDIVISPTTTFQKKELSFTYSQGNDAAAEIYKKDGKRIYGDYLVEGYTVNPTDHPNDFAQDKNSVQLTAQSTPCNTISGTSAIIPKFVDSSGEFVEPGLRFLYRNGTTTIALYNEATGDAELVEVATSGHYSVDVPSVNDKDLNFAPETPLHLINANPFNNLFNTYYRDYLNEIYSPSARRLECKMTLDINDITSFQFADKIYMLEAWWRLIKISNFEVGQGISTQCEFVKLIDSQLDCESTPYQITTQGIVQFQEPDESITFGSEDCCNRYQYTWNADNSRCYANGFGGGGRPNGITTDIDGGNLGLSGESGTSTNRYNLTMVNKSVISPDTVFSFIAGSDITIEDGNEHAFVAGENLFLKARKRGAAVIGKNTRAVHGGLHMGGGWFGNDYTGPSGQSQYGVIQYIGEGDFTTVLTEIPILIEGYEHLNIENGAALNCVLNVSIIKFDPIGKLISDYRTTQFSFAAYKAGDAKKSTIHQGYDLGGMGNTTLEIDTTTNVAEHRFALKMAGLGHPHLNVKIAASLIYTQIKE